MGGLITAKTFMIEGGLKVNGCILSSPLFGVALKVSKIKEGMGRALARFVPHMTMFNEIDYEDLTRDKAVQKEYELDSLRHDKISLALYLYMQEEFEYAMEHAHKVKVPFLLQQSGADRVVSVDAATGFFDKVGSADKKLLKYDGACHESYNDIGREKVYSDLVEWLNEKC
jgi:alpha-beta hydrolase superfamily lysophospholipase